MQKQRVLVMGRNASSNLCMARSLGRAGCEVEVLRIFQTKPKFTNLMRLLKMDACSQYVKKFHTCISNNQNHRILEKLISIADPHCKMLLVPTCDLTAAAADEYSQQLEKYYLLPSTAEQPYTLTGLMQKDLQTKLAREAGLPVVNSCVIKVQDGQFEIPDSVRYPCFIKPNISKDSTKSYMKKCTSREDLEKTLAAYSREKNIEMLVEDYIEIKQEYALLGLSTKSGVLCPGLILTERSGHDERRGVNMVGRVLPSDIHQELIDQIRHFITSLRYEGLFDVDLIESTEGKLYFVELNLRFGASGYAITESGVNLPGMFADYMFSQKPIDPDCQLAASGKRFVSEKVLLDEYCRNFVSLSEVKAIMHSADIHFIQDTQDTSPYRHFRKFYLFGAMTRIYFKCKSFLRS